MAHEMIGTQIVTERLVALLESGTEKVLLIDSRPFVEYNTSHILEAININCSKLMKRRLQQDKVLITELIQHSAKHKVDLDCSQKVVVYDQSSQDVASLASDCFLTVLLGKLEKSFSSVHLLAGGFAEFSRCFPGLCEGKSTLVPTCISQPCLPVANIGPTRILPNLYLGCQRDVLNKELMQQNGIGYVLNASNTCPKPDFIPESHFLRVPVNDSFCEKILPWLDKSVDFIEKAKASNGCVLVHCLAGISRSATIAIAYIMKRMDMSLDEAYSTAADDGPLIQALNGLHLPSDRLEDSGRLKRSFSLDIKSVSPTPGGLSSPEAALELYKPATSGLEGAGKPCQPCQFSPVQEVSEQTPEASPDREEAPPPRPSDGSGQGARPRPGRPLWSPLHRSGSVEDRGQPRFLFGLSASQQHLATSATGLGLEGWHSDLLAPQTSAPALTKSWYFTPEPPHFYSASAVYGGRAGHPAFSCSQLPTCGGDPGHSVRRRHKPGDRADSRRSWHEESPFEKQFKRRSCQMEFGESIRSENRSREELGKVGSQSSFSGSMEIIEVS
nr:dual specificity protein phosphatase 16 [Odocoileus virginianus texanus]